MDEISTYLNMSRNPESQNVQKPLHLSLRSSSVLVGVSISFQISKWAEAHTAATANSTIAVSSRSKFTHGKTFAIKFSKIVPASFKFAIAKTRSGQRGLRSRPVAFWVKFLQVAIENFQKWSR